MALLPWQKGLVTKILDETHDTRRFMISIPARDSFDFKPGQFVTLDLPIHDKPSKRLRSYSIASAPDGTNTFELIIVLDRNGSGTNYLFNEVKEGTELALRGPLGVFSLEEEFDRDIFMICTGTGIAPFRSMVIDALQSGKPFRNIYLVFGCRTRKDLLYHDELKELEKRYPVFHYLPSLSREVWEGHTGYVHAHYEKLCGSHQPASFYLCGWRGMIDEARQRILEMGYDKKDIHQEIYG